MPTIIVELLLLGWLAGCVTQSGPGPQRWSRLPIWTSSSRRTNMSGPDDMGSCFPCKLRDFSSL
jgi:hypothetical protein